MVNKSGLFRKMRADSTHQVHELLDVSPVGRLLLRMDLRGVCQLIA